jgi:hypothetical protein
VVGKFALSRRKGLHYPGERAWTKTHRGWLASQKLEYQRIAFEEMLLAMRQAQERIERLEQAIRVAVPDWSQRPPRPPCRARGWPGGVAGARTHPGGKKSL